MLFIYRCICRPCDYCIVVLQVMFVNMVEANKIPHFGYDDEYDLTNLVAVRKDLKHDAKKYDIKLSYLPFILKAVSMSLLEYPILNSSISEDQESIIYKVGWLSLIERLINQSNLVTVIFRLSSFE